MDQHHDNKPGDRGIGCRTDRVHRPQGIHACSSSRDVARGLDRRLVVLRAAQFEHTLWTDEQDWNWHEAALHGSSHYHLPLVLRWFTANIGVHHVHHLCSGIPYYRLPKVLRDFPELRGIGQLTLLQSFRCVRLVLWDEKQRRMVSFRDVRSRL
jgi:fatty acid desaturase